MLSKYNFPGAYSRPVVQLKDLNTGITVFYADNPNINADFVANEGITLIPGHNYEAKATLFTSMSNAQLKAEIDITWKIGTSPPVVERGGGLRIKEIKNYTSANVLATTESYEYPLATPLTPIYYINSTYSEVIYQIGFYEPVYCSVPYYFYSDVCRIYNAQSIYSISTIAGSPFMYDKVTKYSKDANNGDNGKTEYTYDIIRDQEIYSGYITTFNMQLVSNDWRNGFLKSEAIYKKSGTDYSLIKKTENFYTEVKQGQTYSLKAKTKYIHSGYDPDSPETSPARVVYFSYPVQTGSKKLFRTIETSIDEDGREIVTTTDNEYTNAENDFLTKTITKQSNNTDKAITLKYPVDFASTGNVYEKMQNKNMVAPVIELNQYSGTTLLRTVKNNFKDWMNDSHVLAPETIEESLFENSPEIRVRYHSYSDRRNVLNMSKENDTKHSYIWGYNAQYPIAAVTNAAVKDIFHTSFEETEGNINDAKTGRKSKTNGLSKSLTGLTSGVYILSYWRKPGSTWEYVESEQTVSGTSFNISLSGHIDEVRFYPKGAQMTTYTYDPLIGITSQCDINNRITYYEYDSFGRLHLIRDQDKNIVKKICYNYAGQAESCLTYGNQSQSRYIRRDNCTGCQIGSEVVYTVPADTYFASSQAAANALAQNEIDTDGQTYANANGTCTAPAMININGYNGVSGKNFTAVFHNNCTGANYTIYLNAGVSGVNLNPQIPTGNYNVTVTPSGGGGPYSYGLAGFYQYANTANMLGVNITATQRYLVIQP